MVDLGISWVRCHHTTISYGEASPPGPLQRRLPAKVVRVESLRPGAGPLVEAERRRLEGRLWREVLETDLPALARFEDGRAAWVEHEGWQYLATWPDADFFDLVMRRVAREAGLPVMELPEGVRVRRRSVLTFAFNFAPEPRSTPAPTDAEFVLGGRSCRPLGWRRGGADEHRQEEDAPGSRGPAQSDSG